MKAFAQRQKKKGVGGTDCVLKLRCGSPGLIPRCGMSTPQLGAVPWWGLRSVSLEPLGCFGEVA